MKKHFRKRNSRLAGIESLELRRMLSGNQPLAAPLEIPLTGEIPALQSNPESARKIYLDFNGEITESHDLPVNLDMTVHSEPYDTDGSLFELSEREQSEIERIWTIVAEDFAPFDVDVTTVDPGESYFTDRSFPQFPGVRVIISTDADSDRVGGIGQEWISGVGGRAIEGSWMESPAKPVWAFVNRLGSDVRTIADTISHEVGHSLGMEHDGIRNNDGTVDEYYDGHGSGPTRWAPIMGNGYFGNVSQWSRGDYFAATNDEDDLSILAQTLTFKRDDIGVLGEALNGVERDDTLPVGQLIASDTCEDGGNICQNGLIGRNGDEKDVDTFRFSINDDATVSLNVTPWPTDAAVSGGRNLDVKLQLLDATGAVVATDAPTRQLTADLEQTTLSAGVYYIRVEGDRDPGSYSDYGSLGHYAITGQITNLSDLPPSPELVDATDSTFEDSIRVTWTRRTDCITNCEYQIWRSAGSKQEASFVTTVVSSEQLSSFDDDSVLPGKEYTYWVRSVDANGTGAFGSLDTGVRGQPIPGAPLNLNAAEADHGILLSWDTAADANEYEVFRSPTDSLADAQNVATTVSAIYFDSEADPGRSYTYWIRSLNSNGVSVFSSSDTASSRVTPPSGLRAMGMESIGSEFMRLEWDFGFDADEFELIRNNSPNVNTAERIYLAAQPSYVLAVPNTTTYYWVRALDGEAASLWSSHVVVAPLSAPTNVSASRSIADSIDVNWAAQSNAFDFAIYRNETDDFESASLHAVVDGGLRSFSDYSAMPQLDYYYWVGSLNGQNRVGAVSSPQIGNRTGREIFEFGEQLEFSSNSRTFDVDLADFNQDGYLDLFVTNSSTVEIWLNDQSGRLTSPIEIRVPGEQLVYADVGDVNNDGFPDAVTANQAGVPLLWINSGDGTFDEPMDLHDETLPTVQTHDVAIVDLDGDSWNDLYLVVRDGADRIWRNETTVLDGVRFTDVGLRLETDSAARSKGVEIADLNNDGCWDAFIANENASNVIFYGIGLQSQQTTSCELPKSSTDRHLAGITATEQYNRNLVNVAVTLGSNGDTQHVSLADVNMDGYVDAFEANSIVAADRILMNNAGSFSSSSLLPGTQSGSHVQLRDLNGDGAPDAIVANYFNQTNQVWINDGRGNFSDSGQELGNLTTEHLAIGDLDNDGDNDVVFANLSDLNTVWYNTTATEVTNTRATTTLDDRIRISWESDSTDGQFDIYRSRIPDQERIPRNPIVSVRGSNFDDTEPAPGINYYYWVVAAGGSPDVVAPVIGTRADGAATGSVAQVIASDSNPEQVRVSWLPYNDATHYEVYRNHVSDFVTATKLADDVLTTNFNDYSANADTNYYYWVTAILPDSRTRLVGPGEPGFRRGTSLGAAGAAYGTSYSVDVDMADLDGDGDEDAVVTNRRFGSPISVFWNEGGRFTESEHQLGTVSYELAYSELGDLDGDGDMDMVSAARTGGFYVFVNMGEGRFAEGVRLGNDWIQRIQVQLQDMDGDDRPDIIVSGLIGRHGANEVWFNRTTELDTVSFVDSGWRLQGGEVVEFADLDQDDKLDAVFAFTTRDPQIRVFFDFQSQVTNPNSEPDLVFFEDVINTRNFALGDLDNDGDVDIFNGNSGTVLTNDGNGTFTRSQQIRPAEFGAHIQLSDIDADGDLDIVRPIWESPNEIWLNDGRGNFFDSGQRIGTSNSENVAIGDFDSDGDLDAFFANVANFSEPDRRANLVWNNLSTARPMNVEAGKDETYEHISLRWDSIPGIDTFRIYRGRSPDFQQAISIGEFRGEDCDTHSKCYNDPREQLEVGELYYYWVQALNPIGGNPVSEFAEGRLLSVANFGLRPRFYDIQEHDVLTIDLTDVLSEQDRLLAPFLAFSNVGGEGRNGVSIIGPRTLLYDPAELLSQSRDMRPGATEVDQFWLQVSNPFGFSQIAPINITIRGVNDSPNIVDTRIVYELNRGTTIDLTDDLLNLVDDSDSSELQVASVDAQGTNGAIRQTANGWEYSPPDEGFTDRITFTVEDSNTPPQQIVVSAIIVLAGDSDISRFDIDENGRIDEVDFEFLIAYLTYTFYRTADNTDYQFPESDYQPSHLNQMFERFHPQLRERLEDGELSIERITQIVTDATKISEEIETGFEGDTNFDGIVDALDLNALALNWQQPGVWRNGDFNGDDITNTRDLNDLALNWQKSQQSSVAARAPRAALANQNDFPAEEPLDRSNARRKRGVRNLRRRLESTGQDTLSEFRDVVQRRFHNE